MDVLVRNLLDAATIDAGALRLQSAPFQVRALVDETVKLFKPVADHKAISPRPMSGPTHRSCVTVRVF